MWMLMAVMSAFFAGITAILAKCGIQRTDSDVATAIRTIVVLLFSWLMAAICGSLETLGEIEGTSLLFLILSGLTTGASWICYFKALSMGDVNKVVPIDKCSVILTVLLAIVIFQEKQQLWIKLVGTAAIGVGTLLMVEKKESGEQKPEGGWLLYAVFSAVFAALTSILAKIGISNVEARLGTAIRTLVVLLMAWLIVFFKGKQKQLRELDQRELGFILLSGVATGASWLCYYYAIQKGSVSIVVAIDKLSILVSVAFSSLVLREPLKKRAAAGLLLIVAGTVFMGLSQGR